MQINRLLEMVYVLLRGQTVTARELAERFNVSRRTIYRDIDTLSLSGIPVYTEKGKRGGIKILPGFVLSKSILNENEQNDILSALQGLAGVKAIGTEQVLQKLSAIFNKNSVRWLEVDFTGWGSEGGEVFEGFKTAILERRVAEFDYYSTFSEKTRRRAEPVQLWFKSKAWYVRAFCLTRQAERLFKLSRVKRLTVTGEVFAERGPLDTNPEPARETRVKPPMNLTLKIAEEMSYRVFDEFDGDDVQKQPGGGYIVNVTWPEDEWVYGFIMSFGEYIEVLGPEHARETLKKKLSDAYGKYL